MSTKKKSLPVLTKIACWWVIAIGGYYAILGFRALSVGGPDPESMRLFFGSIYVVIGTMLVLPSIILLKTKRKVFWFLDLVLFIILAFFELGLGFGLLPLSWQEKFLIFAVPVALFILDIKNRRKIK